MLHSRQQNARVCQVPKKVNHSKVGFIPIQKDIIWKNIRITHCCRLGSIPLDRADRGAGSIGQEGVDRTTRWRAGLCTQTLHRQSGRCLSVYHGIFQLQIATQGGRQIAIEDIAGCGGVDDVHAIARHDLAECSGGQETTSRAKRNQYRIDTAIMKAKASVSNSTPIE
jgi:hypothetical protein